MTDATALHREMIGAVLARDWDRLRRLYHADYVYRSSDGVAQTGVGAAVAVAQTYTTAFPDLRIDVAHQWASGDTVSVVEAAVRGTHQAEFEGIPATGKAMVYPHCNVIEVRDGKIYREREYSDAMAIMRQLGVIQ
jgi:steroid delta-isomerase-like uncharacterized protein